MLILEHLSGGYNGAEVIHDVTLEVADGSVVALLGPNGAGKTTLLRMASGLLRPTSGRVLLGPETHDVSGLPPAQRARCGLCHVPEGRGIFPSLSVRENLALAAARHDPDDSVGRVLEMVPMLRQRLGSAAGSLSGGQQQLLALARAFVRAPRMLMVDEASLGLAPIVVDEVFEFMRQMVDAGGSLLIVEQFVSRALAMADRAYLIRQGIIVFEGSPTDIDEDTLAGSYIGHAHGS